MIQERLEPFLLPCSCCLPYALQRLVHDYLTGSVPCTRFASLHFLRPLSFAPSAPSPADGLCSRTFFATMAESDFPCPFIADYGSSPSRRGSAVSSLLAGLETSRFPRMELLYMLGSPTTPNWRDTHDHVSRHVAFRLRNGVGDRPLSLRGSLAGP